MAPAVRPTVGGVAMTVSLTLRVVLPASVHTLIVAFFSRLPMVILLCFSYVISITYGRVIWFGSKPTSTPHTTVTLIQWGVLSTYLTYSHSNINFKWSTLYW